MPEKGEGFKTRSAFYCDNCNRFFESEKLYGSRQCKECSQPLTEKAVVAPINKERAVMIATAIVMVLSGVFVGIAIKDIAPEVFHYFILPLVIVAFGSLGYLFVFGQNKSFFFRHVFTSEEFQKQPDLARFSKHRFLKEVVFTIVAAIICWAAFMAFAVAKHLFFD